MENDLADDTLDDDFDAVMEAVDPAMLVVTTEADGERSGCLVGFHCQCSIEPRRYAVWISRLNHTFDIARRAEHLTLHLLGPDDHDLAAVFGSVTGDEVDKWEALAALGLELGGPSVRVRRVEVVDDATCDHLGLIVEPVAVDRTDLESMAASPLRIADVQDLRPGHPA
jgi:hypothetical protein